MGYAPGIDAQPWKLAQDAWLRIENYRLLIVIAEDAGHLRTIAGRCGQHRREMLRLDCANDLIIDAAAIPDVTCRWSKSAHLRVPKGP